MVTVEGSYVSRFVRRSWGYCHHNNDLFVVEDLLLKDYFAGIWVII